MKKGRKIYVGLSGGVDSAVAAHLLKKEGHEVTGVFIKAWQPDFMPCTLSEDRLYAMRNAATLGIPFKTLDLEKEYKTKVIDYLIKEYERGRTPNPDVMCNREIKFRAFLDWAQSEGAEAVATGHYARIEKGAGGEALLTGVDETKDQSYFLWSIKKEDLSSIIFPLGLMNKREVRQIAKRLQLPSADRKDSQGLCFVGAVDMKEFLRHFIPGKRGSILNEEGREIGWHDGAMYFTLGERHGFHVTDRSGGGGPYYVTSKNMKENTLTVSTYKPKIAESTSVLLENPNILDSTISPNDSVTIMGRYRSEKLAAIIKSVGEKALLVNVSSGGVLVPGQSGVLYRGDRCLGGGIIA